MKAFECQARDEMRYLGIDVGGSFIKWGVISREGKILLDGARPTPTGGGIEGFYQTILDIAADAAQNEKIGGIGICTAGIVDTGSGVVLGGVENIPYLAGEPLQAALEQKTGLRVRVLNDVNAVLLGERWNSGAADGETVFCITVGTGIGGSLMRGGTVVEGAHFRACEIGYINFNSEEGSFETLNSAKALLCRARAALKDDRLTEDEFFKRVALKAPVETRVYMDWIDGLARRIADIILIIDPDRVLVGGGITERGDALLLPLKEAVSARLPRDFRGVAGIELASRGNKAGILGAAKNFIDLAASPAD